MTTPQDSPKRRKQKARRTRQLAEWRLKKEGGKTGGAREKKPAAKTKTEKKAAK